MKAPSLIPLFLALFAQTALFAADPVPTILSTDIGSDMDDTWALAQILRSPELDLKMVLIETEDTDYGGRVAARQLDVSGHSDVPIALGFHFGKAKNKDRNQWPWVKDYELERYPGEIDKEGVAAFIALVRQTPGPINIIAVGPAPALAAALKKAPELAKKCRFFGMYGSIETGYDGKSSTVAEYNVKHDVASLRTLLAADWLEIKITPLDTCGIVSLAGSDFHSVWCATNDPLVNAVIENHCIWMPRASWAHMKYLTKESSTLYDCVAVYMAYDTSLLKFETVTYDLDDDGFMRRNPKGAFTTSMAMAWKDLPTFESDLARRILGKK